MLYTNKFNEALMVLNQEAVMVLPDYDSMSSMSLLLKRDSDDIVVVIDDGSEPKSLFERIMDSDFSEKDQYRFNKDRLTRISEKFDEALPLMMEILKRFDCITASDDDDTEAILSEESLMDVIEILSKVYSVEYLLNKLLTLSDEEAEKLFGEEGYDVLNYFQYIVSEGRCEEDQD